MPHIAVANAYWSPFGRQTFDLPAFNYPLSSLIGRRAALSLFRALRPIGFAMHTRPLNRVLGERGLPPIGGDIRTMYTFGDYTAYVDLPELAPAFDLPAHHRYIGAVLWAPKVAEPAWWHDLPADRPIVYVTRQFGRGASPARRARGVGSTPSDRHCRNRWTHCAARMAANARVADFLPGVAAAARASLGDLEWRQPYDLSGTGRGRPGVWASRARATSTSISTCRGSSARARARFQAPPTSPPPPTSRALPSGYSAPRHTLPLRGASPTRIDPFGRRPASRHSWTRCSRHVVLTDPSHARSVFDDESNPAEHDRADRGLVQVPARTRSRTHPRARAISVRSTSGHARSTSVGTTCPCRCPAEFSWPRLAAGVCAVFVRSRDDRIQLIHSNEQDLYPVAHYLR